MFNPSRDQARNFFFDTWAKHLSGEALSPLEQGALSVILLHPEYHALLSDRERNGGRDFAPENGQVNPFLHLSLHLAIDEQLSIDQPPGICARFAALATKAGSEHDARHEILDCLGETIWQAQRTGTAPDQAAYLECLDRKVRAA